MKKIRLERDQIHGDVSSASPSSERMRGLWVNGVKKGIKEETDLRGNV